MKWAAWPVPSHKGRDMRTHTGLTTGPTALLTPVYPYLLAGIFAGFGLYTKASA